MSAIQKIISRAADDAGMVSPARAVERAAKMPVSSNGVTGAEADGGALAAATPTEDPGTTLTQLICGTANSADAKARKLFTYIRKWIQAIPDTKCEVWEDIVAAGWGQIVELGLLSEKQDDEGEVVLSPEGRAFVAAAVKLDPTALQQRTTKLSPFSRIAKAQLGGNPRLGPDVSRHAVFYKLAYAEKWTPEKLAGFMGDHVRDRHRRDVGGYVAGAAKAREILFGPGAEGENIKKQTERLEAVLIPQSKRQAVRIDTRGRPQHCRFTIIFEVVSDGVAETIYVSDMPSVEIDRWIPEDIARGWPKVRPLHTNRKDKYRDAAD